MTNLTDNTKNKVREIYDRFPNIQDIYMRGNFSDINSEPKLTIVFSDLCNENIGDIMVNLDLELNKCYGYSDSDYQISVGVIKESSVRDRKHMNRYHGEKIMDKGVWVNAILM